MFFDVDVSLRVGESEIALGFKSDAKLTALVGPSGVGKTSVLNAIAGLLKPTEGRIEVAGEVLFDSAHGMDLPPERRRAGYVFQDARLFPHKRVAANLAYGEKLAAPEDRWIGQSEVVDLLEIGDLLQPLARHAVWRRSPPRRHRPRPALRPALPAARRTARLARSARAEALTTLIERIRDTLDVPILLVSHSAAEVERLSGKVVAMGAG